MRPHHPSPLMASLPIVATVSVIACTPSVVDDAALATAADDPDTWITHGRTYDEQRHSPLRQVNEETIDRLSLAWSLDLQTKRGVETTPLAHDGVLYVTAPWSIVRAVDAATGALRWTYDPRVNRAHAKFACCDVVSRGVALYRGKVFVGTLDGRLVAIDAVTGRLVWEVQTTPVGSAYTITGAPRIARGLVVIGNGGAEFGVRGYVSAYDADTGELRWRTFTVPGDPSHPLESEAMRRAAETWSGEWWHAGGGGTAWDAIVYDPDLDLVFVGTGNGSPWYRRIRSPGGGDNLYLSSILALRAEDGEQVWHYQTTPGDNWDYTATQPLMLAELTIDGRARSVIMQAPKNGFFYVLDRATGELISAEPYTELSWATGIDDDGRPLESFDAGELPGATLVTPGPDGAHNWYPMSYHPTTGLVYFPVQNGTFLHIVDEEWSYRPGDMNVGRNNRYEGPEIVEWLARGVSGRLVAWDPVAQREVWRVTHPNPISGGTLSTGGNLVFQGRADGMFRAYRATDGEVLWEFDTGTGIVAAPITYRVDGVQFVAVATGFGGPPVLYNTPLGAGVVGPGRLLAFRLDGAASLPPVAQIERAAPVPMFEVEADLDEIREGGFLYGEYCVRCHGIEVISRWLTPDLRYASTETHLRFEEIVRGGERAALGMPSFADDLTADQVRMIQAFILLRAAESSGSANPEP